jgi:hypothetical protein
MKKKIYCFLIFLNCCVFSYAQQVVSTGGNSVKSDFSVTWILGGSLTGIPVNDLSSNFNKEQPTESEITLKVYPNPASDFINIEIAPVDTGRLVLELYNNTGLKVLNKIVTDQPVLQVNIKDIPSGVYFLKLSMPSQDQLFKIEKIIKK